MKTTSSLSIVCCLVAMLAVLSALLNPRLSAHARAWSDKAQSDQEEPVDFKLLISQLGAQRPAAKRIEAAKSIGLLQDDPRSLAAIDALMLGLNDPDDEVRYQSLANISFVLSTHKRACPIEIFRLADDTSPKIKTNFWYIVGLYDEFCPGALSYCLDYYESLGEDQKSDGLMLLAKSGGKNKVVMKILFDAVNSDNIAMRINGTAALWAVTQDFELLIPLHFDFLADFQEFSDLPNGDQGRYKGIRDKRQMQFLPEIVGRFFNDHLANRHDSFIKTIRKFTTSRDVVTRRKCTWYLVTCIEFARVQLELIKKTEQERQAESTQPNRELSKLERGLKEDKQAGKARRLFNYRQAVQRCPTPAGLEFFDYDYSEIQILATAMANDPDQDVATNAKLILKQIESMNRQ